MPLVEISRTESASSLNYAAHAAFVPIGIVTVLLGPLLPTLSARWSLNYAQAGSLFTAQFIGSTLGVALSGVAVSRWGYRFAIKAGLLAVALGVGALPFSSRSQGWGCIFCYGCGLGLSIPACNLLVAAINPARRSAALSRLNFSWSVGAVACPFLIALAAKVDAIQLVLLAVAGFLLLVLLGIATMPSLNEPATIQVDGIPDALPINWCQRSLFVLAALFFLYVGTESAVGGWIASYAKSLGTSTSTLSVITPSFFYAALMVGRWIAPFVLKATDDIKAARAGLLISCVGMSGLLLSRTIPSVVCSGLGAGFGLAAVYPITISRLSLEFGPAASRVGSVMFTMSNLGGASLPWSVGYFSHQFNNLRIGLVVPLAATVLMYFLYQQKFGTVPVRRQPA
jgi:MFS transporter, FHS family, glucose/mannose:H+ symporter